MFRRGRTLRADGSELALSSSIFPPYAEALYREVLRLKPRVAVEIGMAHGASSLAILTALEQVGGEGRLISIDPFQGMIWEYCGTTAVARANLGHRHEFIEEADWAALPRLLAENLKVDFGYIDGSHAFDYALLDTFYLDKLIPIGGVLGFNDCGLPAIGKVIGYLLSHRRYVELDVGLPMVYGRPFGIGRALREVRRNPRGLIDALRRLTPSNFIESRQPHQDRYFQKTETWEPHTDIPITF